MPREAKRRTKAGKASSWKPTEGDRAEARVAQLWFWEGFYSRSGIDLRRHYQPEPLQVTDLDLLAFEFSPVLQRRKYIGETKTGTGRSTPRPLDRIVWLRGLASLVGADGAELTSAIQPTAEARQLGVGLDVRAQTLEDLARREQQVRIDVVGDSGSHGETALLRRHEVHATCSSNHDLEQAYWFLRSEVWFLDPWMSLKRTAALVRHLAKMWAPKVTDDEQSAVAWLLAETVSVFTLNLVTVAREAIALDRRTFETALSERLAAGAVSPMELRRLADAVDRYVAGVLRQVGAPAHAVVESMGAFQPTPPEYAAPLAETAARLAASPQHTRTLPRYLDLILHERLVRQREPAPAALNKLGANDLNVLARAARLVAAFLRGQADLPLDVAEFMGSPVPEDLAMPSEESASIEAVEVSGPSGSHQDSEDDIPQPTLGDLDTE